MAEAVSLPPQSTAETYSSSSRASSAKDNNRRILEQDPMNRAWPLVGHETYLKFVASGIVQGTESVCRFVDNFKLIEAAGKDESAHG